MPRGPYDRAHQAERERQLAELPRDGSGLCPRCGRPMFPTPALAVAAGAVAALGTLDLDDFPGIVWGGQQVKRLSHRLCNRRAGAVTGNRLRGMRKAAGIVTRRPSRPRWLRRLRRIITRLRARRPAPAGASRTSPPLED